MGGDMARRRFLAVTGGTVAAAVAGAIAVLFRSEARDVAAAPTTTSGASAATTPTPSAAPTSAASIIATSTTGPPPTTAPPLTTTAPTTTSPPATVVPVICKQAWGAQPAAGEFRPHTITQITVHHTAVVLAANTDAPSRARQHQRYHQGLGWPDLAYHFLIDANGHVYEGRPLDAVGDTATNYDPTGHLLVCCEGDFNKQEIGSAQVAALATMLAWGAAEFDVDPTAIHGHRDLAATTCPGDNLYALLADGSLPASVSNLIATEAVTLDPVCGDVAENLVANIEAGAA